MRQVEVKIEESSAFWEFYYQSEKALRAQHLVSDDKPVSSSRATLQGLEQQASTATSEKIWALLFVMLTLIKDTFPGQRAQRRSMLFAPTNIDCADEITRKLLDEPAAKSTRK